MHWSRYKGKAIGPGKPDLDCAIGLNVTAKTTKNLNFK